MHKKPQNSDILDASTGVITGYITSFSGVDIPQAIVTAVSPSGTYRAATHADGNFTIAGVQPDTYTISVTSPGYDATTITGVTVFAGMTTPFYVTLQKFLVVD